jgi:methionyl aminopeptidase
MKLKTAGEIDMMREAGHALARALLAMKDAIVPGQTTTLDLDEIGGEVLKAHGAKAALNGYKPSFSRVPYAHNACISINNEVIHGVPSAKRIIRSGDLVSLDMDASIDGWCADATITVAVGEALPRAKKLLQVTRDALYHGIAQAKPGNTVGDIGHAIEKHVLKNRMGVVRDMVGHGIGRMPHEPGFDVPNWGKPHTGQLLRPGMTFCIEPMVTLGSRGEVEHAKGDVWTLVSVDGTWAAHWEHTVAITETGVEILTALPRDASKTEGVEDTAPEKLAAAV